MEGIKDAIEFIAEMAVQAEKPEVLEIDGKTYCTSKLARYDEESMASPITATTLTSLVDYIRENREELRERMIIQVADPSTVLLYSGLLPERKREGLFEVRAMLPKFEYGREYGQEDFLISLQSCFLPGADREEVSRLASNIVNARSAEYTDDGITQQAVVKTGITTKENSLVPNPVTLTPYRTFLEVPQPESDFIFRIGERSDGSPSFRLVSADGGSWKSQAMSNVKAYLTAELEGIPERERITIIA